MTVFSFLSLFIRGAHYVMDFDSWFSKAKCLNSNDETQSDFLIRPPWTGQSNLTNCLDTGYPYSWWLPILFQNDSFILCSLKGNFPSAAGSKSEAYIFLEENIRSFWATIPPPYLETANEFLILFNVDSNTHHFFRMGHQHQCRTFLHFCRPCANLFSRASRVLYIHMTNATHLQAN